jgi:hypothetical protein
MRKCLQDVVGRLGLDEGFGVSVVVLEVGSDGRFELPCRLEASSSDLLLGQRGEEAFHPVEPAGRSRIAAAITACRTFVDRRPSAVMYDD